MKYKREYAEIRDNKVDLPENCIILKLEGNTITYLTTLGKVLHIGDKKAKEDETAQLSNSLPREPISISE
jgi:hypothetical protein